MEFHEKLQQLRKQTGLTQEELAQQLYVSRTAISKWESGRGFPNIDSLKAISRYFHISLDELLSGEELLALAEQDHKKNERMLRDLVFGLLDCGIALLLFLPLFGQRAEDTVRAVSLLDLSTIRPYLKATYLAVVLANAGLGILTLALQNCQHHLWVQSKHPLSLGLGAIGVCLFVISQQPYAAVFTFVFFIIKAFMLIKRH